MTDKNNVPLVPIPYLPPVSWFVTVLSYSTVCWFDSELYDKRRPRNRCRIATSRGAQDLIVPLEGGRRQRMPLNQIKTATGKWQREHIHAIQTAYGKSPFFIHYSDALIRLLSTNHESLAAMNMALIRWLLKQLNVEINELKTTVTKAPLEIPNADVRYRQVFSDKVGFLPDCSAIDLLFNYGPDAKKELQRALVTR